MMDGLVGAGRGRRREDAVGRENGVGRQNKVGKEMKVVEEEEANTLRGIRTETLEEEEKKRKTPHSHTL